MVGNIDEEKDNNDEYDKNDDLIVMAIDGVYNNDKNFNDVLNMGFYNVTNSIPLDVKSYGKEGKNREVGSLINYIENNKKNLKMSLL